MKHHEIAIFADTLYKIGVKDKKLVNYYEEFSSFTKLISKEKSLNTFLMSPRVKRDEKKDFLKRVLGKSFSQEFIAFIIVILAKRCQIYIRKIFRDFEQLVDRHESIARGKVTTVNSLDKKSLDYIANILSKRFNKKIILSSVLNEKIIGGIIIEIEDIRIDMSIQQSLESLKEKILTTKVKGAIS
ncbi:MAG: ATP synthase F1 subunit delta [Spirochaetota bacterium]|nr:ATP synthase F1 subunit delta [Spirochaetota bacterium]